MNRAKIKFVEKLNEYFRCLPFSINGKTVCVCLSGGADSVSLLLGMLEISMQFSFNVCACHFNHLIRGEDSDNDEMFCKRLCEELSVKLYCGRDDVPSYAKTNKLSLEEAARECRYAFFSRIARKDNIDFCATAHNMNDDAETLLFNLIRGSGMNGASAIAPFNDFILRPMLKIGREEVEEYLSYKSQGFVTDLTNFSNDYTRNYIRNVVFPELRNINPSFIDAFSRFIESARCDRDYFERLIEDKLDCDLRNEHKSIRYRVYLRKCKDAFGFSLNSEMIGQIDSVLFEDIRTVLNLNSDVDAIVENGKVSFFKHLEDDKREEAVVILKNGINHLFNNKVTLFLNKSNDLKKVNNLSTTNLLSSANINGDLFVRNRRTGDRITIHGINKSLKKLFIDKKIPKEYRDIIPIISDSEGIIYVPFVGVADRVYAKNGCGDILINTVFHSIDSERWVNAYEK